MKLYWFSDEEGSLWEIIAAHNEDSAWRLLAKKSFSNEGERTDPGITVAEAREQYELNATTEIGVVEGEVATIFPLEVNFSIKESPGSEKLGHLHNI